MGYWNYPSHRASPSKGGRENAFQLSMRERITPLETEKVSSMTSVDGKELENVETVMQIRTSKRIAVVAISAAVALSLSGCAAGKSAETSKTKQVTDGADASIATMGNAIKVSSILVVAQEDGSGVVIGSVFNGNTNADELLGVAAGGKLATLGETSYPVTNTEPLSLAGLSKNASVIVPGLNAPIGTRIKVQFFFAHAGEVTLTTIVREKAGEFASVS